MEPDAAAPERPTTRVVLALTLGVTAIAFAAIFFKKADPMHPLTKAGLRLAIATLILLPFTLRAWRRGRLDGRFAAGAAAGLLYGVHFGAWVWSLQLTTVAASVTLVTATPLLLGAIALLTGRDRPAPRFWWALGLAAIGVATIGGADLSADPTALLGDALALLGAAAMALYLLIVRRAGPDLDVWPFMGVSTAVGAASLLATAAATSTPIVPPSWESLGWIALAALIPQLIGHALLTWAVRYTNPSTVGLSTLGEPVGSTALAFFWLGEDVPWGVALGCTLTLTALLLALVAPRPQSPPPP